MKPSPTPPPRPHPDRSRRVGTGLLVAASFIASTASIATAIPDDDAFLPTAWAFLGWFYGFGVAALLAFYRRYPVHLTVLSAVGALFLPLDSFGALVGLTGVIATRDRGTAWRLGTLTAVATAVSLLRDLLRPPSQALFASAPDVGEPHQAGWWVYLLVFVACVAVSVTTGYARRAHGEVAVASSQVVRQTQAADALRTRVSRQEERELIAREVHDALASRLSLVSLHAGALEVAVPPDLGDLRDAAHVVRENAHASLEDLRDLVALLKDPEGLTARYPEGTAGRRTDLASIQALVDDTRSTGVPLVATVLLEDARAASPQLGRAAFRIVQESLTNARKHAPGRSVDLDVRASAADGVRIRVSNPLPTGDAPAAPGSRAGVTGLVARATQLGGRASAGVRDGRFVVEAWLPWSAVATPPAAASGPGETAGHGVGATS